MKQKKVIGFLAREHGLNALYSLVCSKSYRLAYVFTHRLNPLSEDKTRAERPEYSRYKYVCDNFRIPLLPVDSKREELEVDSILENEEYDFIASISWRRLIPMKQIGRAVIGAVNLHRGKLPNYKGAEPIKQALLNRENYISITAHHLAEEIDSGKTIATYSHPVNYDSGSSLEGNIARLKAELTPHFAPLLIKSFKKLEEIGK